MSAMATFARFMMHMSRKRKCTSNGKPMPFVRDHAKSSAPIAGPMARASDPTVMATPCIRPRASLGTELLRIVNVHVKAAPSAERSRHCCTRTARTCLDPHASGVSTRASRPDYRLEGQGSRPGGARAAKTSLRSRKIVTNGRSAYRPPEAAVPMRHSLVIDTRRDNGGKRTI